MTTTDMLADCGIGDFAEVLRTITKGTLDGSPRMLSHSLLDLANGDDDAAVRRIAVIVFDHGGEVARAALSLAEMAGLTDRVRAVVERMVRKESVDQPGFMEPGETVEQVADELFARAGA